MGHLAEVLHLEGRDAESAVLLRETAAIQRRTLGPSHRYTLYTSYNLACVLAADHKPIEALSVLRDVVENGFANADDLKSDPDFKSLRGDPRFKAMIEQAKQRDAPSDR